MSETPALLLLSTTSPLHSPNSTWVNTQKSTARVYDFEVFVKLNPLGSGVCNLNQPWPHTPDVRRRARAVWTIIKCVLNSHSNLFLAPFCSSWVGIVTCDWFCKILRLLFWKYNVNGSVRPLIIHLIDRRAEASEYYLITFQGCARLSGRDRSGSDFWISHLNCAK